VNLLAARFLIWMLLLHLQFASAPFGVDQLPMSDTVMGVWTSLVKLAGTTTSIASIQSPTANITGPFSSSTQQGADSNKQ